MDDDAAAGLTLHKNVEVLMRRAVAESMPSRGRRMFRDVILAVHSVLLAGLLVFAVVSVVTRHPTTPAPSDDVGVWPWTDPVTGLPYLCGLIDGHHDCVPRKV